MVRASGGTAAAHFAPSCTAISTCRLAMHGRAMAVPRRYLQVGSGDTREPRRQCIFQGNGSKLAGLAACAGEDLSTVQANSVYEDR